MMLISKKYSTHDDGFSLLEMLVVVAIIGMLSLAIFGTTNRNSRDQSPRSLAIELQNALRETRQKAIVSGEMAWLTIHPDEGSVISSHPRIGSVHISKTISWQFVTARSLTAVKKTGQINFFSDGSSTGGYFLLKAPKKVRYKVLVSWLTGSITVKKMTSDD